MPIAGLNVGLNAEMLVIVALAALAGLTALVLLQGLGLRRRFDEMIEEDNAAHATLRTAADRVARIESETISADQEELRVAVAPALSERLGELARRNGVSVAAMARTMLDRGAAAVEAEMRRPAEPATARQAMPPPAAMRPFEEQAAGGAPAMSGAAAEDAPAYHSNGSVRAPLA